MYYIYYQYNNGRRISENENGYGYNNGYNSNYVLKFIYRMLIIVIQVKEDIQ